MTESMYYYILIYIFGVVKVSTGVLKLVKLSAEDASNLKLKLNAEDNLALAA